MKWMEINLEDKLTKDCKAVKRKLHKVLRFSFCQSTLKVHFGPHFFNFCFSLSPGIPMK